MTEAGEIPTFSQYGAALHEQALIGMLRDAVEHYDRDTIGYVIMGDPMMTRVINAWLDPRQKYGTYADTFALATDLYCPPGEVWLVKMYDVDTGLPITAATPAWSVCAAVLRCDRLPRPLAKIVGCSTAYSDYACLPTGY